MTPTEFVPCPDGTTCFKCGTEEPAGLPVALIAVVQGRGLYACAGCVRDVEGAAT